MTSATKHERLNHVKRMELGLIGALALLVVLFVSLPKRQGMPSPQRHRQDMRLDSYELPPPVRLASRVAPPALPQVPLVSEDESLPTEASIEESVLNLNEPLIQDVPEMATDIGLPVLDSRPRGPVNPERRVQAGSIELALLIDSYGRVDSLYVIKNPSGNQKALDTAIRTAYRTRYVDECSTEKGMKWIRRKF